MDAPTPTGDSPASAADKFTVAYSLHLREKGSTDAPLTARVAGVEVALAGLHSAVAARGGAAAVGAAAAWPAVAAAVGAASTASDAVRGMYEARLASFDAAAGAAALKPAAPRRRSSGSRARSGGSSRGPAGSAASSGTDSARKRVRPPRPRPPAAGGSAAAPPAPGGGAPKRAPPKRSRLAGGSTAGSTAATPAVSGGDGGGAPLSSLAPLRVPPPPPPRLSPPPPPIDLELLDLSDMLLFVRTLAVRGGKAPSGVALSAPPQKTTARFARRARVALRCEKLGEKPKGGAAKRYAMAPGPDGPARRSGRARVVPEAFLPGDWTPRGGRRVGATSGADTDGGASDSDWSCGGGRDASPARAERAARRAARRCGPAFQADLPPLRERRTRGVAAVLEPDEAAWIAHRVLGASALSRSAGPAPIVMVGSGKDEGAGFTPWAYVVQRTGKPVPPAAAADLGLGTMGAPVGAAWTDDEAAAFEAALDAHGRSFLLRGLGQATREASPSSSSSGSEGEEGGAAKAEAKTEVDGAAAVAAAAADGDGMEVDSPRAAAADDAPPPPPPPPTLAASPDPALGAAVKAEEAAAAAAAPAPAPAPVPSPSTPAPTVVRSPMDCVNYYYNVWKTRATPRARAWYERRAAEAAAEEAAAAAAAAARVADNARRSAVATEAQRRRRMREMVVWARECARAPTGFDRWPSRVTRYRRAARAMANANVAAVLAAGGGT